MLRSWLSCALLALSFTSLALATAPPASHGVPALPPSLAKCDKIVSKIYTKFCSSLDRKHNGTVVHTTWTVDDNGDQVNTNHPHYANTTQQVTPSRFRWARSHSMGPLSKTLFKLDFAPAHKTRVVKKCELTCEQAFNYIAELECIKAESPRHSVNEAVEADVGCGKYTYRVLGSREMPHRNSTMPHRF